jgi:amino acid adenylation domain-containing protein
MIEAQVARAPDAVAVIDGDAHVAYRELDARANGVAHALRNAGVTVETPVGVYCEPSVDQVIAVLAILKAGAAYVPIDPEYPAARCALIAEDAKLPLVVTHRTLEPPGRALRIDEPMRSAAAPAIDVGPEHALYVLYTSGSTGVPKGVVGVHRAIVSRLAWQHEVYPYEAGEIACARTPLGFVDSVAEIFAPLASGVPLAIVGREARRDPTLMIAELAAARVTRIVVVPALLATLFELYPDLGEQLPELRTWFIGGEPVPVPLVERFRAAMPGRRLINIYGSTEVSGDATYFDFDRMPPGLTTSPIGIPLRGVHARILDDQLHETDVGEVCVSGVCLARGYLNRDALTAASFVANPFPEGGKLYRMGDLGRRLPTGDIQYLGRNDQMVKLRGMRVDLGEVEARLAEVVGIAKAVAVARDDGRGGCTLVAFYTVSGPAVAASELRAHLAAQLPSYMVPSHLVELGELPLNASRKIDRRALRDGPLPAAPQGSPPTTDEERRVARAWEEVLGQAPIGRDQSFHDLGGTSLQAVRIAARLRDELGVAIPLGAIFAHPTVAALTAQLATLGDVRSFARPPIAAPSRPIPPLLPLSHYQFPFWFFRALTGDVSVVSEVFGFSQPVELERLQRAFSDTIAAFDTLWMRFPRWRPVQQLMPRRAIRFAVHDRRHGVDATAVLAQEAASNNTAAFDLEAPPHVHARLVLLPGGDHRLLVAIPHVAIDMTAMELFRARLQRCYAGAAPDELRGATLADLVAHEAAPAAGLDDDARYWAELCGGDPWNAVPARLCATKLAGRRTRAVARRELDPVLVERVARRARDHASSLPIAIIGSISAALGQVLSCDDPTLLLMIEKRDRAELRSLFTTMTALMPFRLRGRPALDNLLARTGDQLMASYARTDHLMRRPTLWNDSWVGAPRLLRRLVARLTARHELLAPYVFAIVPFPRRRRGRGREILIAVNILPEVYHSAPAAPAAPGEVRVERRRTIDLILRPGDLIINSDAMLDRTLQIHVTREGDRIVINLYGGGIDQAGLDEIARAIAGTLERLAAPSPLAVGA